MASHKTHKRTADGKRETLARRQARAVKTHTGPIRITPSGHTR
ncbi:hypothetical protein [Streptomyces sp. AC495_CC817]|nr:hypothetical protein [Streptomyces sp. AC495_CC817]